MSPLDIIDREGLIAHYKVTPTWIREHGRASGGVGKPMTWQRSEFEDYYFAWRARERQRHMGAREAAARISSEIDSVVRTITSARSRSVFQSEMRGKGGQSHEPT